MLQTAQIDRGEGEHRRLHLLLYRFVCSFDAVDIQTFDGGYPLCVAYSEYVH